MTGRPIAAAVVVFLGLEQAAFAGALQLPGPRAGEDARLTLFVTLPMTDGFADATDALVEAKKLVRESIDKAGGVRLVERPEEADVVLTVLGRGRGDVELTAALRALDRGVSAPPVPIAATERYIEVMLTVGSCVASTAEKAQVVPRSCYKRVFVGVGFSDRDGRRPARRAASNSWEACADAVSRDVRAWLDENTGRVRALR